MLRAHERAMVAAIARRAPDLPFSWSVVGDLSREVCGKRLTRQWLSAVPAIAAAYAAKRSKKRAASAKADMSGGGSGSSRRDLDAATIARLRLDIADRDRELDHYHETLLRILKNARDGGVRFEDLLADLPPIQRRGVRTDGKTVTRNRATFRFPERGASTVG